MFRDDILCGHEGPSLPAHLGPLHRVFGSATLDGVHGSRVHLLHHALRYWRWCLTLFDIDQVFHLFEEFLRGLLLYLELRPGLLDRLQSTVYHLLNWPDCILFVRINVDIKGQVSQRHQLEDFILNLDKLIDARLIL